MFLTSTQKQIMSGQQHNTESERQHLLDRLLDAVKQCQVRFGGKTELATDGDSRVVCLLTQLEAIFQHGFKKSRVSAFRQVGQAAGIVKLESDSVFWNFVKGHLEKLEVDRFLALEKATTDAGRGRAWLRSALNEHSLERYFHHMVGNKTLLSNFYEKEAFLMDEERASMLPMIAAGLSPILFALTVDSEDLNIVRQVPALTINKDVFSNILPSFPQKQVVEPAPVYSAALTDESKQEKKRKKKKKKRNAAIVSIEEDDSFQVTREHVKDFPLDDSTVEETFKTNSDSKTSTTGHTRSSSYPGNIVVVAEGTTEKKSRVNGQEIVFTEITKSISLPDNSMTVENIADSTTKATKTSSFDFEDFLEKVSSGPRYDTVAEGVTVQETTTGDDRGNFNFDAAGLFLNQLKVDSHERNVPQLQNATKSDNSKETSSAAPTVSKATSTGYLRQIQGDLTVNESDLLQRRNVSEGESFDGRFSSTKSPYSQAKEDSPRLEQKLDSSRVYRLADEGSSNGLNFSLPQTQVPTVLEKTTSDTELANESQGSAPEHVDNLHISKVSVEEDSSSAQESYDLKQSPSRKTFHQERTGNRRETDEDKSPSGLYDSETETISESQSVEPVVLLDGGEPLVPLAEGGDTAKTGAQSTFYYVPDVSADNDQDSASVSSASWSYVEDVEEFSEKKGESLLNNRSSSAMTSDASAAVAALAACSDAQRGMDNMSRGFVALERTTGDQSAQRDYSSRHDGMSTGELKQAIVSMMLRKDEIEERNRNLQSELDEVRYKSQQLSTETEDLREELKQQENFNTAKIASLSRENELLKHQLKKYVGAVQALRSDLQGKSSETVEVLSGIRQDDVLPPLPPERNTEQARQSEEAEEYKRKLIQVADLHGELLEFNDRLHKQVNYYQYQVRRLREELVNLRGPLPEDLENLDHTSSLSDFDPAVMSVGTRPLVNVWIPSVFLRGRSSNVHHVYQVYVRIKDDEWNVYRRYSQFFDMHKTLRRKFAVVDSFKFPPKKTLGNKDSRFVEDRRRLLQDYLRRVVNLYVTSDQELRSETTKNTLLQILPFFAEPLPPEKANKEITSKRKRSVNYSGL